MFAVESIESVEAAPAPRITATGAEVIVQALEQHGVDIVAGIPGGALLPLYEALARCSRIRHVLARHEQAAGFIAQGLARITGRAGVCLATSGPGVTNILTALADAKLDSVPLVCITGQVPSHLIGTDAFQEVATVALAKPITKAAFFARSANDLSELIAEGFHIAESGRPGPVLIDVPKDVQMQSTATATASCKRGERLQTDATLFEQAAALIRAAQRPVIYAGGGIVKARAELALRRFAERASMPVTTTLMAMGALPHDHPLNLGMLGMHGSMATHHVLEESDLVIAIGARFDDRATGDPRRFLPKAKIVHIDIDTREFGKIKTPTLAIHADACAALTQLLACVETADRETWRTRVNELRARHPTNARAGGAVPHAAIQSIGALLPKDAILTTDVGQHQMWVAQSYPFSGAGRWLTSGGLGTMGFGLPAAIGASLADPEATVVCFTGDGSLLMNIQELATLAELNLNVKIVLLDNGGFGLVRQQQALFYRQRYNACAFERPSDLCQIATAFGIEALALDALSPAMLTAKLGARGPLLMRVPIVADAMVLPMVAPGAANVEALQ